MNLNKEKKISILIVSVGIIVSVVVGFLLVKFGPCVNRTDLIFMLDDSGSIKNPDFEKTKGFVKTIVNSKDLQIEEKRINVALTTFTDTAEWMSLEEKFLYDEAKINSALDNYQRRSSDTNMISALEFVKKSVLEKGRENFDETILIFLTDGKAFSGGQDQNVNDIKKVARDLKNKGIKIYSVGVGNDLKEYELKAIASAPSDKFVRKVDDFDELQKLGKQIGEEICEPNWYLGIIPLAIALALIALKYYLNKKELNDFEDGIKGMEFKPVN